MSSLIPYKVDYAGRQVDIELLQSIQQPVLEQQVTVSNVAQMPKIVAGIEKLVQRYANALLTSLGTVYFDRGYGTDLLSTIMSGRVQDQGKLQNVFGSANVNTIRQLQADDADTDTYGTQPADEQLKMAELLDFNIDYATSTIYLQVLITSQAGTSLEFIVPVTAPR
jgi:hypothetical protein